MRSAPWWQKSLSEGRSSAGVNNEFRKRTIKRGFDQNQPVLTHEHRIPFEVLGHLVPSKGKEHSKNKTVLTRTGLLMEGFGTGASPIYFRCTVKRLKQAGRTSFCAAQVSG